MKKVIFLALLLCNAFSMTAQSWKAFDIISGNPNATGNELRFINTTTGCLGTSIATTNGIPAGNNNLPYGAAFDPTEGKLYYSKAGTTAGTSVFNVYNNTGATATNTNLSTISGGEFFRMGVGQDGNVYGTIYNLVIAYQASNPRIDFSTVKLTRYNPTTNVFTVLGNIQCPSAYASTMPSPYNTGDYWSSSSSTTTPFYAAQLGSASYGDLVISPDNTMYVSIGKKLIKIPNYETITGTGLVPSVEVGNVLPTGVGYNFTTQGSGTYGLSWDYNNQNILAISSRTSDGSDGSYNLNPTTAALVGSFRVNCLATPTSANFADLTSVISSIGAAKQLTNVQYLGYNNKYRLTYQIKIKNLGTSIIKAAQLSDNIQTAFPALTISNVSASFASNPASLVLNSGYNGTSNTNLLDGTKTLYSALYNGTNLNGGGGTITAGSDFATINLSFDVANVAQTGTTYSNTAAASGNAFDGTSVTDNSDNGANFENATPNLKADDTDENDATPIKFGSTVSGTVWNDTNNSANNTLANVFTTGESGTNATGLFAILIEPITNTVIGSTAVAANGTYSFANVPSFTNLRVLLSTTAGTVGSTTIPTAGLPTGWVNTSPLTTNITGDINTGTYNSADASRFGATDDANNDFGVQRRPETAFNLQLSQVNAVGVNNVTVPASSFLTNNVGITPNTGDYDGGTIASIRITTFPLNATSITIGGTIYTIGNFPGGGVTVPYTNGTGTTPAITIDPIDGAVSVVITYVAIDNAGFEDLTTGSVTLPFSLPIPTYNISGTVFNDAGGLLADATVNGTGTNISGTLYANLLSGGAVVQSVLVANDGTYAFPNVTANTSYTVIVATSATATTPNLPTNWVNTGENIGTGAGNDGTVNGTISVAVATSNVTDVNFGLEQLPVPTNNTAASQTNPGGTTDATVPATTFTASDADGTVANIKITAFPTNATSITINGTNYTSATFPVGGVTVPTNASGNPTQAILIDPIDGAITVAISYKAIDNADKESTNTATASVPFTLAPTYNISGTVFNDAGGLLADATVNGTGTNISGALYANLLSGGAVVQSVLVGNDGTYAFPNVTANTSYTVIVATSATATTPNLPTNWVNTGENIGTGAGNDGTVNGTISVAVATSNVTDVNFGLDQLPVPTNNTAASQTNPGGTTDATVPATTFTASDADGTVANIKITAFPTNATSITINGTNYTSATFPVGGVTVPTNASGNPTQAILIDPIDGAITVAISYKAIDNAGEESATTATASVPFGSIPTYSISGNVYDDANGLTDATVNGTGTNASGTLYANLLDNSGNVVATTAVANNGTYTLSGAVAGTYTVQISTNQGTVSNPAPATALPTNWANTGENIGTGAGNDGTTNGNLAVTLTSTNITNANFGVEQLPIPANNTAASQVNPGGTNNATVAATTFTATDADGTVANIKITAFPTNATSITINGTNYTSATFPVGGVTVPTNASGNPTQAILIDPIDGAVTVAISYKAIDNAGEESTTVTASLPFSAPITCNANAGTTTRN